MQAGRWQLPPAFLLPSWSSSQLGSLQHSLTSARTSQLHSTAPSTPSDHNCALSHSRHVKRSTKNAQSNGVTPRQAAQVSSKTTRPHHTRGFHSTRRRGEQGPGSGGGDGALPFPSWRRVLKGPESLSLHVRLKDWKSDNGSGTATRTEQRSYSESTNGKETESHKNVHFASVRPKGFRKAQKKFMAQAQNGQASQAMTAATSTPRGKVRDTTELLRQVPNWTPTHTGDKSSSRIISAVKENANQDQELLSAVAARGWGAEEDDVELAHSSGNRNTTAQEGQHSQHTSDAADIDAEDVSDGPCHSDLRTSSAAEDVDRILKLQLGSKLQAVEARREKVREWAEGSSTRSNRTGKGQPSSDRGSSSAAPVGGPARSRMAQSTARAGDSSYIALDESRQDDDKQKSKVPPAREQNGSSSGSKPSVSLLEELFPELAGPEEPRVPKQPDRDAREVPRLELNALSNQFKHDPLASGKQVEEDYGEDDDYVQPRPQSVEKPRHKLQHVTGFKPKDEIAILVLKTADTLLSEADFERIQPRGAHIEEWRGRGSYLKVIPVRNATTLSPIGHYLLMFRSASYRTAYRQNAERLAALASRHVPASLDEASILPYRGMPAGSRPARESTNPDGSPRDPYEDVGSQITEYALTQPVSAPRTRAQARSRNAQASSNSNFFWRESDASQSRVVQRLVANRGYERLAGRAGRAVLFWVDGFAPLDADIRRVLRADGRDRGIAWSAAQRVERFEIQRNVEDGEQDGTGGILGGDVGAWSLSIFAFPSGNTSHQPSSNGKPGTTKSPNDPKRATAASNSEEKETDRGKTYSRWILTFDDEDEARRFVRGWHLREWPEERAGGDLEATMHAEFLW